MRFLSLRDIGATGLGERAQPPQQSKRLVKGHVVLVGVEWAEKLTVGWVGRNWYLGFFTHVCHDIWGSTVFWPPPG